MAVVGIVSEVRCGMCLKDGGRAAAWVCGGACVAVGRCMHVCVAARAAACGACSRSSQGDCNTSCCVCIPYVCPQGIQDMLLQYLQLVMGFNTHDQAVLITVIGAGNFTVQVGASAGPAVGRYAHAV